MQIKVHPFDDARAGDVFAILFGPAQWGYVRFYRHHEMAVLSVYCTALILPNVDWENPPVGWVLHHAYGDNRQATEAVRVGVVPFSSEEEEKGPPCFVAPFAIIEHYMICRAGNFEEPFSKEDVEGMREYRPVTLFELAEFLKARWRAGELSSSS